ncbi:hypothetical protein L6Q21_16605 [Sandaracinobacter sp. RS1-74]|uniref:hypothetical protein n=1 Tax=Sandaracinobacteroides sayramensis TaxID=2913411 RepID=UPI001EDADCE3|nr:hypothetical protein [Sandaracinobacteroides sayramensis]MCG2842597.1 hypothetical protein [Sandaracinobacteroides sayramensis]
MQSYLGVANDHAIVGFRAFVVGEVRYEEALERLTKGLARHPVPIMLLARLGASEAWQDKRIGAGLLYDFILRTLQVAEIGGVHALWFTTKTMRRILSIGDSSSSRLPPIRYICSHSPRIWRTSRQEGALSS